jgi:hypothetical protein
MANEIQGAKSYATMYAESTWGTKPGSPIYVFMPVDSNDIQLHTETRQTPPVCGLLQPKYSKTHRGMPSGSLAGSLFGNHNANGGGSGTPGSLAQYILDWFLTSLESITPPSKGLEWTEGPGVDDSDCRGLRVNGFTISGADGGAVKYSLDVMGKSDVALGSAQSIPNDMETLPEFEFAGVVLEIDSTPVMIDSFQITGSRNLKPRYMNSTVPTHLMASPWTMGLQFQLVKNASTYSVAKRLITTQAYNNITITMVAPHNGTGASGDNTTIEFDFPRCHRGDVVTTRNFDDLNTLSLPFNVLKPDSASAMVVVTYSLTSA